ncbi:MAG: LTA synthase family protein, partial [Actinomycetota bacterium]|nr:LTA synthase family protein [Actinomycetota bacterium]
MSRQEWIYLLSLLVPFVVYNLSLKATSIASRPTDHGLARTLSLMQSDVFFNLGYVLLWIGLFVAMRRGLLRWVVVVLFHAVTVLVVIVTTCAVQYFRQNGTTLDYGTIAEWIPKFNEIVPILVHDVPLRAWLLLVAALLYVVLGPWIMSRLVEQWRPRRSPTRTEGVPLLGPLGLWLLALCFVSLSLLTGNTSLAREPFVNVVLTGVQEATAEEYSGADVASSGSVTSASNTVLAPTFRTEKRNVVLIHLESTRAESVTPYNESLKTTPFLNELAKKSFLAERTYTTVPRSSKASVGVNCGVEPPLYPGPEFEQGGIPARCLASLLREQGYSTAFFASTSNNMDNFGEVVEGFGYQEFYPVESMSKEGFAVTNTFGYEDDIMLGPSEQWLTTRGKSKPFLAEYFTGTGHYGYECLNTRYGSENFSNDDQLNRYHNCLRYLDFFVKNLMDQYKKLGLYEDTIFVLYGDHGEGF